VSGLILDVDAAAWRAHLQQVAEATPGLVPVAKGNGYGFGLGVLAAEAERLGSDAVAVGVADEVAAVRDQFSGDVVVLTPWRPGDPVATELLGDPRVITTISRVEDLAGLPAVAEGSAVRPRVLVEVQTSMRRHGIPVDQLRQVVDLLDGVQFEGWVIHLPHAEPGRSYGGSTGVAPRTEHRTAEAEALATAANAVRPAPLWFSHLASADAQRIATDLGTSARSRVGTQLWLGAPATRTVTATVIDVHPVRRGDRIGYWQRRVPHNGWVVIVAGGTAHGIAMEAPTSARSARARGIAVANGVLAAAGRALSPYTIDGRKRWFAEPPHMQSSMVLLPADATPPAVGDRVQVEARLTTASVDRVELR